MPLGLVFGNFPPVSDRLAVALALHNNTVLFPAVHTVQALDSSFRRAEFSTVYQDFFQRDISLQDFVDTLAPWAARTAPELLLIYPDASELVQQAKRNHVGAGREANGIHADSVEAFILLDQDLHHFVASSPEFFFILALSDPVLAVEHMLEWPQLLLQAGCKQDTASSPNPVSVLGWYLRHLNQYFYWLSRYPHHFCHIFVDDSSDWERFYNQYKQLSTIAPDSQHYSFFTEYLEATTPPAKDTSARLRHQFTDLARQYQNSACCLKQQQMWQQLEQKYGSGLVVGSWSVKPSYQVFPRIKNHEYYQCGHSNDLVLGYTTRL